MLSRLEVGMLQKVIEERQSGRSKVDLLTLSLVSLISGSHHPDCYKFPSLSNELIECFRESIMPNTSWPEVLNLLGSKNQKWRSLSDKWIEIERGYRKARVCELKLEEFSSQVIAPLLLDINGISLPIDKLELLSSDDHYPTFLIEEQVASIVLNSGREPYDFLAEFGRCEDGITSERVITALAKVCAKKFIARQIDVFKVNIRPSMPRQAAMMITSILFACLGKHRVIDEVFMETFGLPYIAGMGFDELISKTLRDLALGNNRTGLSAASTETSITFGIEFDSSNAHSRLATIRDHFSKSTYVTSLLDDNVESFFH